MLLVKTAHWIVFTNDNYIITSKQFAMGSWQMRPKNTLQTLTNRYLSKTNDVNGIAKKKKNRLILT